MKDLTVRLAFEAWASSQGLLAERAVGGERYRCDTVQSHWVAWQAALAFPPVLDRCWVQRTLMERIHSALHFYGNPKSYKRQSGEGSRGWWVLAAKPSAEQLASRAAALLCELDHPRDLK
jgi:hypothetical protein